MSIIQVMLLVFVIVVGGAFGGFLYSLNKRKEFVLMKYKVYKTKPNAIDFGSFTEMFFGIGASLVVNSLGTVALHITIDLLVNLIDIPSAEVWLLISTAGISVAAGYAGLKLLERKAGKIINKNSTDELDDIIKAMNEELKK
ncbi:hypothetical protein J2S74_002854 [Evansella vedderi]|uniref:Uncharacterized protein n=1 Tax=Evansella vedderi TaxID=38282 RepID=A0ABT9ZW62_9BACI|nr:hypothetical protein [Evansella vedderi]MDQ0255472.1 hypothetical protein [Evansella vedderi]